MRDATFRRPRNETFDFHLMSDRDRHVLVVRNGPVRTGSLIEEENSHGSRRIAEDLPRHGHGRSGPCEFAHDRVGGGSSGTSATGFDRETLDEVLDRFQIEDAW